MRYWLNWKKKKVKMKNDEDCKLLGLKLTWKVIELPYQFCKTSGC